LLLEGMSNKRRGEKRVSTDDPAEISGVDRAGQPFHERIFVSDVSASGCRFDTRIRLQCGDIVTVKPTGLDEGALEDEHSELFEVIWTANHGTKCSVGVRKVRAKKIENAESSRPTCPRFSLDITPPEPHCASRQP